MARREIGTIRFQDYSRWLVEIFSALLLPTYVFKYVIYVQFRKARVGGGEENSHLG